MAQNKYKVTTYLPKVLISDNVVNKQVLDYLASTLNDPRNRLTEAIPFSTSMMITPEYAFSPDILSFDTYGTEYLWWLLCRYNGIIHPMHPVLGFVPGNFIKVPAAPGVSSWLKNIGFNSQVVNRIVTI